MTETLSEDEIALMERAHAACALGGPCEVQRLIPEIRRLQRENRLLHLSRGSAALVGRD